MFTSVRSGHVPLSTAADVILSAFSLDVVLQDIGGVVKPKSKTDVPLRAQRSLKDIFAFAESQVRLVCQGLVEEYKDVAAKQALPDTFE